MLRIIILIVIAVAAVWFMAKDARPTKIAEDEREQLELAKQGVARTEEMAAQMADQTDAIRNEAFGNIGANSGNEDSGGSDSAMDLAGQAAQMQEEQQQGQ